MNRLRRAFTLVELLVVIAIIGILVALLLPAVQSAREAARRMQCSNHVKQLGLAVQMYHDIYHQFPWGGKNEAPSCCNAVTRRFWNWNYHIFPFIEQQGLFDLASDAAVYATPISIYHCPTRRRPQLYSNTARTDYAGNAGTGNNALTGVLVESNIVRVTLSSVTDGTSNTILIGEKQLQPRWLGGTNGTCCDDNEPYVNAGWDFDIMRVGNRPPATDQSNPNISTPQTSGSQIFGSRHPGGVNFVLVDGSVQHIPYSVDAAVFSNLCDRRDGNPVSVNF